MRQHKIAAEVQTVVNKIMKQPFNTAVAVLTKMGIKVNWHDNPNETLLNICLAVCDKMMPDGFEWSVGPDINGRFVVSIYDCEYPHNTSRRVH